MKKNLIYFYYFLNKCIYNICRYGKIKFNTFLPEYYFRKLISETINKNQSYYDKLYPEIIKPGYIKSIINDYNGDILVLKAFCDTLQCIVYLLEVDTVKKTLNLSSIIFMI